jgi:hypothetical protein
MQNVRPGCTWLPEAVSLLTKAAMVVQATVTVLQVRCFQNGEQHPAHPSYCTQ